MAENARIRIITTEPQAADSVMQTEVLFFIVIVFSLRNYLAFRICIYIACRDLPPAVTPKRSEKLFVPRIDTDFVFAAFYPSFWISYRCDSKILS